MEPLILVGLISFALLSWLKPNWALFLLPILLPTYQIRFNLLGIPVTFLELMILVLGGFLLLRSILYKTWKTDILKLKEKIDTQTLVLILLFLTAGAISIITAPSALKAAGIFKAYIFEPVILFFIVVHLVNSSNKLRSLFNSMAIAVIVLSGFGIYQFFTLFSLPESWWAVDIASRRITSLVNHPNALAHLLGPILAVLIGLVITKKNIVSKKLLYPSVGLGLLAFYLTFSRAGWLALIVVTFIALLVWYSAIQRTNGWSWKKITTPFLFLVFALIAVLAVPFSREKIMDLVTGVDLSQQNRYVLWSAAVDIIKNNPIFGVGLTGFREAYKAYPLGPDQVVQNYPHNFFLNFWVEMGLLGLISITGLLLSFYKRLWKKHFWKNTSLAIIFAAAMSQILLHGLVDVPYFKNDLSVLFWLILALPYTKTLAD